MIVFFSRPFLFQTFSHKRMLHKANSKLHDHDYKLKAQVNGNHMWHARSRLDVNLTYMTLLWLYNLPLNDWVYEHRDPWGSSCCVSAHDFIQPWRQRLSSSSVLVWTGSARYISACIWKTDSESVRTDPCIPTGKSRRVQSISTLTTCCE